MELKEMALPSINKFASDYMKNRFAVKDFFHYDLNEVNVYEKRYHDLMENSFNRKDVSLIIENYMSQFGLTEEVRRNIDRLKQKDSVVVIGGQQAGLLTGPLYTIHKVISIIIVAKEQEALLGKPVIPVFWIAGEDHDLEEVNHVFVEKNQVMEKIKYPSSSVSKKTVTDMELEEQQVEEWLRKIFASYDETAYTKDLYNTLKQYSGVFPRFADYFACIINELFGKYGLLLIDSGSPQFRKVQASFFETLIHQHEQINAMVREQQAHVERNGYKPVIMMGANNANLFYYDQEERVLLEFDKQANLFKGKNSTVQFTKERLLEVARYQPEKLSNNVVTRPLMQEFIFPVQAFISGPGEIAYWAELKKAFEHLEMVMPLIVPRMNITILEPKVQKDLLDVDMDLYEALVQGTQQAERRFQMEIVNEDMACLFEKMESQFHANHQLLAQAAEMVDPGLQSIFEKNNLLIQDQFNFLRNRIQQSLNNKHLQTLHKFAHISNALHPNDGPQERTVNIYYYLNQYGPSFIDDLMKLPFESNTFHKIVVI
ncbi:MAG: bacillithiol biosynthesis cysteine-adding enzyme BshC [Bacillus sp. (in: firmicutes)]